MRERRESGESDEGEMGDGRNSSILFESGNTHTRARVRGGEMFSIVRERREVRGGRGWRWRRPCEECVMRMEER